MIRRKPLRLPGVRMQSGIQATDEPDTKLGIHPTCPSIETRSAPANLLDVLPDRIQPFTLHQAVGNLKAARETGKTLEYRDELAPVCAAYHL